MHLCNSISAMYKNLDGYLPCPQHAGPFFILTGEEFDFELTVKFLTSYASKFTQGWCGSWGWGGYFLIRG